jgi:hypothetical protein
MTAYIFPLTLAAGFALVVYMMVDEDRREQLFAIVKKILKPNAVHEADREAYKKAFDDEYAKGSREAVEEKARADARKKIKKRYGAKQ